MHLVGPVDDAQRARRARRPCARPKSSDTPAPPCAWIAQSITSASIFGAATLIIAISARASLLPTVSIM